MATNKIQTGLRLTEIAYDKLRTLATRETRSLNNLIEHIVQEYLDAYEAKNGIIEPQNEE